MKQQGFTLIELFIILGILAIISTMAAPSVTSLLARIQHDQTRNTWQGFLNQGRANAITYQSSVIACPFDFTKNKCSERLNGSWLLFTDDNRNKTLDADEMSLQVLNVNDLTSFRFYPSNRKYIRFYNQPTGIYSGLMGSVTICPNGKPDTAAVHMKLNIMGRVASAKTRGANNIVMRESGNKTYPIQC